jgi:hypothetical protein
MESRTNGALRFDRTHSRRPKLKPEWHQWPDTSTQHKYINENNAGLGIFSRPDIGDESMIAWGLAQSHATDGSNTTMDVLYGEGLDLRKHAVAIKVSLYR